MRFEAGGLRAVPARSAFRKTEDVLAHYVVRKTNFKSPLTLPRRPTLCPGARLLTYSRRTAALSRYHR